MLDAYVLDVAAGCLCVGCCCWMLMCWMLQPDAYLIGFGLKGIASSVGFDCRPSPCQRGSWRNVLCWRAKQPQSSIRAHHWVAVPLIRLRHLRVARALHDSRPRDYPPRLLQPGGAAHPWADQAQLRRKLHL